MAKAFNFESGSGFQELADDLDEYNWAWIDMADGNVCPDCIRWGKMDPAPFSEWIQNRAEPGRGESYCGDSCRCLLAPMDLISANPDLVAAGPIIIKDIGELIIKKETSYETFAELDRLIVKYKGLTGNAKLPPEWYALDSVEARIDFLKGFKPGSSTPPPAAPKPKDPIKLGPEITQAQIDEEARSNFEAASIKLKNSIEKLLKLDNVNDIQKWAKENTSIEDFRSHSAYPFKGMPIENVKEALARLARLDRDWKIINSQGGKIVFTDLQDGNGVYASANQFGVSINKKEFADLMKLAESYANDVHFGYHPQGTAGLEAIITHEFAHVITEDAFATGKIGSGLIGEIERIQGEYATWLEKATKANERQIDSLRNARSNLFSKFHEITADPELSTSDFNKLHMDYKINERKILDKIDKLQMAVRWDDDFISRYADKNLSEFAAEAFAKADGNALHSGKYADAIYKLLKSYYWKHGGNK
jgi:hypothetical protein